MSSVNTSSFRLKVTILFKVIQGRLGSYLFDGKDACQVGKAENFVPVAVWIPDRASASDDMSGKRISGLTNLPTAVPPSIYNMCLDLAIL